MFMKGIIKASLKGIKKVVLNFSINRFPRLFFNSMLKTNIEIIARTVILYFSKSHGEPKITKKRLF